jgi:multiple sugar transport system substrate-binding protein
MMFSTKKGAVTLAAVTGLSIALAGCSAGGSPDANATVDPNEKVTLDFAFWGNDVRAGFYQEAFDLFHEEHPNISVNSSVIGGFPEYWEKRQIEAAGGDLPDVMQFDYSYIRQYAENDLLLDLAPFFGGIIQTDAIPENVLGIAELDGETVALPTGTNAWANFVNTPLVEGGTSWDEYVDWVTQVTDAGGGTVYGATTPTARIQNFELELRADGKSLFTEDGEPGFTEDDLTAFWEKGAELTESGVVAPQQRLGEVYPKDGIGVGLTTSALTWDNFGPSFSADLGVEPEVLDLVAPPVTVEGAKDLYLKPALLHAVSASTEHPEAAALLVDFLINSPEVGAIFGTSRGLPASETQLAGVTLGPAETKVKDYEASIADRLGDAPPVPVIGYGSLEASFKDLNDEISLGTLSVEDAVTQYFDEIDTITNS